MTFLNEVFVMQPSDSSSISSIKILGRAFEEGISSISDENLLLKTCFLLDLTGLDASPKLSICSRGNKTFELEGRSLVERREERFSGSLWRLKRASFEEKLSAIENSFASLSRSSSSEIVVTFDERTLTFSYGKGFFY